MSYTNDLGTGVPPSSENDYNAGQVTSYRWTLSGEGTAYLTLSGENTNAPTVTYSTPCHDASGSTATLTLTVTWPDGSTQSATAVITIPQQLENPTAMTVAPSTMELVENGAAGELELTFTPTEHVNTTVNSVSSATAIATASGTTVTPVSVGQTTVTVTSAVAPSVSGSVTVLVRPKAPTISYTMSNDQALVTITNNSTQCTDDQLQYKTGSGDWTNYSAAFLVNSGVEITARLLCTSCGSCGSGITSPEVKESPVVTSGVRGDYVILNDYEDHSWSYYSDPLCPIRSLNPVDVKITYYGNGSGDGTAAKPYNMTTTDNADNPTSFGANATGVKVGIAAGEDQSTFVYYKTLERADGSNDSYTSKSQAVGDAGYTMIPNPFQVRPVYGTGNTKYRGFYAWRVKAKSASLTIKNAATPTTTYAVGGIIPAETKILFSTANEYGDTVEFEALWARAYVTTGSSNMSSFVASDVTSAYERNFHVVNANANTSSYQKAYPCTVIGREPNSTTLNGNRTLTNAFTASADTKFEDVVFNGNGGNYTANNHILIFGRGNTGTVGRVQGISATTNSALDYTIRMESLGGTSEVYFLGRDCTARSTIYVNVVLGCDYDRSQGDNSKLTVASNSDIKYNRAGDMTDARNRSAVTFNCVVKSGTFQSNVTNNADDGQTFYCGFTNLDNINPYNGLRRITVEGGALASLTGGRGAKNATYTNQNDTVVYFRIKGGTFRGSLVGGATNTESLGGRKMVITGGTVQGWVAGGANGTNTTANAAATTGNSYLYIGGNAIIGGENPNLVGVPGTGRTQTMGGNVFGAGRGNNGQAASIVNSTIVIADNADIRYNVYGGGNYGYVVDGGHADLHILGGTVHGAVFGGANNQKGPSVGVTMRGGTVEAGVFGGSNITGTVAGPVEMNVIGGTVGVSESSTANVHGGGFGNSTGVTGNIDIVIGHADSSATQPTIYGDVYGGSAMGTVNGTAYSSGRHTLVTVNQGLITGNGTTNTAKIKGDGSTNAQTFTATGSVYGGGLGTDSYAANVYGGTVKVTVNGGTMNRTFGANNANGLPYGSVETEITGGTIGNVYGGGNAAPYGNQTNNTTPTVTMTGGTVLHDVFGGGLGANARVTRNTHVDIKGTSVVNGNVFGGGSEAEVGNSGAKRDTLVNILGSARVDGNVYGGGNRAKVWGNTVVNVGE